MQSLDRARLAATAIAVLLAEPSSSNAQVAPKAVRRLSAEQFRSGIELFTSKIFQNHPNPYATFKESEWRTAIQKLVTRTDSIGEAEASIEVAKLVGMLQDGHSWSAIDDDSRLFSASVPLRFWWFTDELRVRAAAPEWRHLVGARVRAIGGVSIEQAWPRLVEAAGGNREIATSRAQVNVQVPEYLRALGLSGANDRATFDFEQDNGRRETVVLPAVQYENFSAIWYASVGFATPSGWIEPPAVTGTRWLKHRDRAFWFDYLPDTRTVFVQFNQSTTDPDSPWTPRNDKFRPFVDSVFRFIAVNPVDRLVIDFRHNNGGTTTIGQYLVHAIIRSDKVNRPGALFVITSRLTESAAVAWAARLESETMALFVGEPPASPPNFYNDPAGPRRETWHIPGSAINFRVARAREQWSQAYDERRTILPDVPAAFRWADFAAGRDGALDAISRVTPAMAEGLFVTASGAAISWPYQHYRRASQSAAWPR